MRVFIISMQRFPRGDAGANYIQYLALALKENCEVIVTGVSESSDASEYEEKIYKGIKYVNMRKYNGKLHPLFFDNHFWKWIDQKYNFFKDDYFIFYGANLKLFRYFIKERNFLNTYFIRVEDLQPYQFKFGRINPKYLIDEIAIKYAQKNMKGTLPISQRLANQDLKYSKKVFILPIMADTLEYKFEKPEPLESEIHFVYPGLKATGVEDDYTSLFGALNELSRAEQEKLKVHITGMTKNKIAQLLDKSIFDALGPMLIFHGYVDYTELINIYINSDFLILPRKINKTTKANFPSKIPEIMSFYVIPICTNVGDYTSVYLGSDNSIIMEGEGVKPCLRGIRTAINMPLRKRLEMRENARKLAENKFDYRRWSSKIYSFLLED